MENLMRYTLKPSLEDMSLVQIAVAMWNCIGVKDSIVEDLKSGINSFGAVMFNIECAVIKKVEELKQPEVFQEKIKLSIKFISSEIYKWIDFHCLILLLNQRDVYLPGEFCFAPHGTIDRKKTAQMIVKDKNLDVYQRYMWACVYCLTDDIWKLWNEMPKDSQDSILNEYCLNDEIEQGELLNEYKDTSKYSRNMVYLWTLAAKKEQFDCILSFPHLFDIFKCSVRLKNKAAIEYILKGLKEQSTVAVVLVSAAKNICFEDPDFLCFLLSNMTEEKQLEVFKFDPCHLLKSFLNWPFKTLFMEIASRMWDFFSRETYKSLLLSISNLKELFREFWQKSPTELKRYVINDGCILRSLISQEDKKNSALFLRDASAIEQKELSHCDCVRNLCKHFIRFHEWFSLEFFIRKCLFDKSSRNEMLQFKGEFEIHIISTNLKEDFVTHKQEWDEIFNDTRNNSKRLKSV